MIIDLVKFPVQFNHKLHIFTAVLLNFFRFKEREENVKADIFKAYIALLKHTKLVVPSGDLEHDDTGLLLMLRGQLPQLIKAVTKQLKEKSLKVSFIDLYFSLCVLSVRTYEY